MALELGAVERSRSSRTVAGIGIRAAIRLQQSTPEAMGEDLLYRRLQTDVPAELCLTGSPTNRSPLAISGIRDNADSDKPSNTGSTRIRNSDGPARGLTVGQPSETAQRSFANNLFHRDLGQ